MFRFTVCSLLALVAIAQAHHIKDHFIPACGEKYGITEEAHKAFNPLTEEWSQDMKCYAVCEFEHFGYMKDGHFTDEVISQASAVPENASEEAAAAATIMKTCLENVNYEDCDGVHSFLVCTIASALGTRIVTEYFDHVFGQVFE